MTLTKHMKITKKDVKKAMQFFGDMVYPVTRDGKKMDFWAEHLKRIRNDL